MTNQRGNWGHCAQPKHAKHELRVIGTSGCNKFELRHGLSKAVEGPRLRA